MEKIIVQFVIPTIKLNALNVIVNFIWILKEAAVLVLIIVLYVKMPPAAIHALVECILITHL